MPPNCPTVRVWSKSCQSWLEADVVNVNAAKGMIIVEFDHDLDRRGPTRFRKEIRRNSKYLRWKEVSADERQEQDPDCVFHHAYDVVVQPKEVSTDEEQEQDPDALIDWFWQSWGKSPSKDQFKEKWKDFLGYTLIDPQSERPVTKQRFFFPSRISQFPSHGSISAFEPRFLDSVIIRPMDGFEEYREAASDIQQNKKNNADASAKIDLQNLTGSLRARISQHRESSAGAEDLAMRLHVTCLMVSLPPHDRNCITKEAGDACHEGEDLQDFFEQYGTHYVNQVCLGGIMEITFTKVSGPTEHQHQGEVKVTTEGEVKVAGACESKEGDYKMNVTFATLGGTQPTSSCDWSSGSGPSMARVCETIVKWQNSVAHSPEIVYANLAKYDQVPAIHDSDKKKRGRQNEAADHKKKNDKQTAKLEHLKTQTDEVAKVLKKQTKSLERLEKTNDQITQQIAQVLDKQTQSLEHVDVDNSASDHKDYKDKYLKLRDETQKNKLIGWIFKFPTLKQKIEEGTSAAEKKIKEGASQ